jgi:hypothetical protein
MRSPACKPVGMPPNFILSMTSMWVRGAADAGGIGISSTAGAMKKAGAFIAAS